MIMSRQLATVSRNRIVVEGMGDGSKGNEILEYKIIIRRIIHYNIHSM